MSTEDIKWQDWPKFSEEWISIEKDLDTAHLPDEVVETSFAIGVLACTSVDNPRMGALAVTINFGGKDDPKNLTPDEIEYVEKSFVAVIDRLRGG